MVKQPELRLEAEPAERFRADGPLAERIREFAKRWQQYVQQPELPACRLRVVAAPPTHVGLGVGTQLGLCVATLLDRQVPDRNGRCGSLPAQWVAADDRVLGRTVSPWVGCCLSWESLPTRPWLRWRSGLNFPANGASS